MARVHVEPQQVGSCDGCGAGLTESQIVVDNGDTIYCRACSRDDKPVPPPPTTYTKVQIETPEEECPCAECGMPLYVGDDAYERDGADPSLYTYCSPSCGRADEFVIKNPTGGSN